MLFSLTVSKKVAPIPPKVPFVQPGTVSDQPVGQPSPVSLSPTPPSTPSPYGLSYPPGYSMASGQLSPASAPPLASPSVFTSTLAKSRPTPKPRQRPTLPPPQPPSVSLSASSPQSTEHPMLDGMSPGESMSTGKWAWVVCRAPVKLSRVCQRQDQQQQHWPQASSQAARRGNRPGEQLLCREPHGTPSTT